MKMIREIQIGDKVTYQNKVGKVIKIEKLMNYSTGEVDKFYEVRFELDDEFIDIMMDREEIV